jgi:hypothetical protein
MRMKQLYILFIFVSLSLSIHGVQLSNRFFTKLFLLSAKSEANKREREAENTSLIRTQRAIGSPGQETSFYNWILERNTIATSNIVGVFCYFTDQLSSTASFLYESISGISLLKASDVPQHIEYDSSTIPTYPLNQSSSSAASILSLPESVPYASFIQRLKTTCQHYLSVDSLKEYWKSGGHKNNIYFWKLQKSIETDPELSRWPCFKSFASVDMPMEEFKNLLLDSSQVTLLNKYSAGRDDVEIVDGNTKIVWSKSKSSFNMKPFDFVTLMHVYHSPVLMSQSVPPSYRFVSPSAVPAAVPKDFRYINDAIFIVSSSLNHPGVPNPHPGYVRSESIFGLNILTPNLLNQSKTDFMSITQVKYSGVHPSMVSLMGFQGTFDYLKHIQEVIAEKLKSKI